MRESYRPIVGSGNHSAILHYNKNASPLKSDQLLLIDAGGEFRGYGADITRTMPTNGKSWSSKDQEDIVAIVREIQDEIESLLKPGVRWRELNNLALRLVCQSLQRVGILRGNNIQQMLDDGVCSLFMPHGLGECLFEILILIFYFDF